MARGRPSGAYTFDLGIGVVARGARAGAYTPFGHRSCSVGNVADTKLNGAAKGATLLQLISLSADVSQGPHGVYAPTRAYVVG